MNYLHIDILFLLISVLLQFSLALTVFVTGRRNSVNISFSIMSFMLFCWSVSALALRFYFVIFQYTKVELFDTKILVFLTFIFLLLYNTTLYNFSLLFTKNNNSFFKILLYIAFIVFIFVTLMGPKFSISGPAFISDNGVVYGALTKIPGILSVYYIFLMFITLWILYKKKQFAGKILLLSAIVIFYFGTIIGGLFHLDFPIISISLLFTTILISIIVFKYEIFNSIKKTNQKLLKTIEEKKHADENINKLTIALEQSPISILMTDLNGNIQYANPAFETITGYSPYEVLGKKTSLLKSGNHNPEFYKELWTRIKHGKIYQNLLINKAKDGHLIRLETIISPIRYHDDDDIHGFISIQKDVTNTHILEENLRQSQKLESIGTLAGGIAHDFNNILTAIIGYCQLAQINAKENTGILSDLNEINNAADRAKELVSQILTISRKQDIETVPVKISTIANEALKLIRASIPTTIDIIENFNSDNYVKAHPGKIHQIIMNLCTNAYYAMKETGGTLTIKLVDKILDKNSYSIGVNLAPGSYIELSISDTGIGMSNEIKSKIFEPYFTTKSRDEGTGLGLSVVQGIVESFGGKIIVYSKPGEGSIFNIYFPILQRQQINHESGDDLSALSGREHILYIDDEENITHIAARAFPTQGYKVTTFTNPVEALEHFKEKPDMYDFVITDLTMPHLSGTALAESIHKIRPELPIILCTGFNPSLDKTLIKKVGIDKIIIKPIEMKELFKTIRDIIDQEA